MHEKIEIMDKLQNLLIEKNQGILLSVKLLNEDELNIIVDDADKVIFNYHNVVQRICTLESDSTILYTHEKTIIYIILPNDPKFAEKIAYKIYSELQLYVDPEIPESYMKCTIGSIKFTKEQKFKATKLLSLLYYSMANSRDQSYYHCYDDNVINIELLKNANKNLNLLRTSLFKKKLKFVYQPIVDRETGNIPYYECLLRVQDEHERYISIGPLIADAEAKGLINIIDYTVLKMAIKELLADENITLSVNISNIGVLNKRFLKQAEYLLKKHKVANRLIIEITETSLNQDLVATKKFIDCLHKLGCRFALDDFGSGFTSFKQLLSLPIDIIKIDGSYIRDIVSNNHSRLFVEALIKIAEDLGIKTVAEFVENGEIAKFLIDIKIDAMQGNFFLPASESRIS